ncbi:MAG TPA: DUF3892 domain-containing protein [Solirubrobacteraceae bacterium]|nr:DUF3892 domain-containing protein [Solirubrobacteraceae bacterium]
MAEYVIACVERRNSPYITGVRTGNDPGRPDRHWTVEEVHRAIKIGHKFVTVSPSTGRRASVFADEVYSHGQRVQTLRSGGDAIQDNNLTNIRLCG